MYYVFGYTREAITDKQNMDLLTGTTILGVMLADSELSPKVI